MVQHSNGPKDNSTMVFKDFGLTRKLHNGLEGQWSNKKTAQWS
jgi:hypothetical protein